MSRLATWGFETNDRLDTRSARIEPQAGGTSSSIATIESGVVRSGSFSGKIASLNSAAGHWAMTESLVASRTYFLRIYCYFEDAPLPAQARMLDWGNLELRIAAGLWRLANSAVQIGSDGPAVPLDKWFRLELKIVLNGSSQITDVEVRVDGVAVLTASGLTVTSDQNILIGAVDAWSTTATTIVAYFDDGALNDDQGADQNTWPGEGKVVHLRPVADVSVGAGWEGGAGGASNLFAALDNKPPVGVAEASGTNTSQARCKATAFPANLDVTLETYAAKGIAEADTVKVVTVFALVGEGADTTGTKAGSVELRNDPVISATITTYGSVAVGTHPANWTTQKGVVYTQPAAKANAPVARIAVSSGTTAARMAHVEALGAIVEYQEAGFKPQIVSYLS